MVEIARVYLFVFGAATVAGGVLGYVKAKSRASLVAGALSGALLVAAGAVVPSHVRVGLVLGLAVSFALAGRFIPAFAKTKKPMPAGMMAVLSVVGIALTALGLLGAQS
ncbi:MAG TPA: TMEM14 family protein [Minicystis sp.]|nr:TMEM14 family protein [Minicystis sp.]